VACCTCFKQPCLSPRSKWSVKQIFSYSNIAMENNIMSRFKCFVFRQISCFAFVLFVIMLAFDLLPWDFSHVTHSFHKKHNEDQISHRLW
jgi:hypothetical protein